MNRVLICCLLMFFTTVSGWAQSCAGASLVSLNGVAWGDSETSGSEGPGLVYPAYVGCNLNKRFVVNQGVSGETSTQVASRMTSDTLYPTNFFAIIWVGRNNFAAPSTVLTDIANMVAHLSNGNKYVILSITNAQDEPIGSANYNAIISLNASLASAYPSNYLDIRSLAYVTSGGTNGVINSAWYFNNAHFNSIGNIYFGQVISNFIAGKNWNYLLHRDLGSSNDNTPMFLDKVS